MDTPPKPKPKKRVPRKTNKIKVDTNPKQRKTKLTEYVEFRYENNSPNDPIFNYEQVSSTKTVVYWNVSHNFYKNYVAGTDENTAIALHALIFAVARSQVTLIGEDLRNEEILDELNLKASDTLKKYFT